MNNRQRWIFIALVIAAGALWTWLADFRIVAPAGGVGILLMMAAIAIIYTYARPDARIASFANAACQMLMLHIAGGILSYVGAALALPLVDVPLADLDRAMGFDWLAFFETVRGSPTMWILFHLAYFSMGLEILLLMIIFNVLGRYDRVEEFLTIYLVAIVAFVVISIFLPAESAWVHYGVADKAFAYHLRDFNALRSGSLTTIDLATMIGLVTFPSFHTAAGAIFIYVCRGIGWLFWPVFALNALMIVSTLPIGGHYLIDLVAGLAALVVIIVLLKAGAAPQRDREKLEPIS